MCKLFSSKDWAYPAGFCNSIFWHTERLQFFKVYLTWLTARCIIHANYNPLSFVTMCALACLLHFCVIESTLSHCMSLSVTFDFLFPKIWDRSLQVIHPLNRETIYQQPLRISDFLRAMILIAYRHAFQFGMNNERQFVLNIRIVALEHGGVGGILEVFFFGTCRRPYIGLPHCSLLCVKIETLS